MFEHISVRTQKAANITGETIDNIASLFRSIYLAGIRELHAFDNSIRSWNAPCLAPSVIFNR